jgi:hypothetical protein
VSLTFEEALAAIAEAERQGLSGAAFATFVVTQDDSRTAWSRGRLDRYADDRLGNSLAASDPGTSFLLAVQRSCGVLWPT